MLKIISDNLWETIQKKAVRAKYRRAAIAYVTDPKLLPLQRGDLLVVDASDASIAGGRTRAVTLANYFEAGVELFSLTALHAKVLVLDDWAVVGSANASAHSASVYYEAAVLSDRPEILGQADKLVTQLANAAVAIDASFIERILRIPVIEALSPPAEREPGARIEASRDQKFWFVGMIEEGTYPGDSTAVEAEAKAIRDKLSEGSVVDWFYFTGLKSRGFPAKADVGDVVIQCLRPRSTSPKSARVFRHGRIAKIFQEPEVNARTFHCVWPADHFDRSIPWSKFRRLTELAGVRRSLTRDSIVKLTPEQSSALFEIWPI